VSTHRAGVDASIVRMNVVGECDTTSFPRGSSAPPMTVMFGRVALIAS
jgi:hypothetical protein